MLTSWPSGSASKFDTHMLRPHHLSNAPQKMSTLGLLIATALYHIKPQLVGDGINNSGDCSVKVWDRIELSYVQSYVRSCACN